MFGVGLPVASQTNCMFEPSRTVWSPLTLVSLAATKTNNHGRVNQVTTKDHFYRNEINVRVSVGDDVVSRSMSSSGG